MNAQTGPSESAAPANASARPAPRKKKESAAALFAAERAEKAKWKSLVGTAHGVWNKISAEELAKTGGNIPALAGLVQLRQQLSRQEADAQVKAFFATHLPVETA